MREPKLPLSSPMARSPQWTRLEMAASMPAVPEPVRMATCGAPMTCLRPASRRLTVSWNSGPRWLAAGRAMAARTRGCILTGPGSRNRLSSASKGTRRATPGAGINGPGCSSRAGTHPTLMSEAQVAAATWASDIRVGWIPAREEHPGPFMPAPGVARRVPFDAEDNLFLLPGPVKMHPRVLAAMARPAASHRGPEFQETVKRLEAGLKQVIGAPHVAILTGSGTAGME